MIEIKTRWIKTAFDIAFLALKILIIVYALYNAGEAAVLYQGF